MLTMETKSQNPMANSNTGKYPPDPGSLDSTAQMGNASGGDWQEEVYQKIKSMKEMYFLELNEVYVKIATNLQQHESLPQQTKNEQLEKLQLFKVMVERLIQFLRLNKNDIQIGHNEKLGCVEKQIINILNSIRPHKPVSLQQWPQYHMQQTQPQSQISESLLQLDIQEEQQQQQNLLQQAQIQTSQQAVLQSSVVQSASLSNLQQYRQSSVQQESQLVHQQYSQSVMRQQQQQPQQASILHQQQTSMSQLQMLPAPQQAQQQHQQLIGQQPNATNIQQNQLIDQPNSIPDLQQQQRLMGQKNNISNLQQQQLTGQQNNLSNMHQPQLGHQSSVSGLQQSQMLGTQSGNSGILANQHSVHMVQQKVPVQQQMQHANLLPNQAQQSETQPTQQQMMSQIQSQNGQLQHLQQQSNPMQKDMQQRLQTSGALLQQPNVVEQLKQLFQSQSAILEASSTSLDSTAQTGNASGGDWREEGYQKGMDNNSWRAAQGQMAQGQGGSGEASGRANAANLVAATTMDNVDWRTQLQADSRHRIINKIMDTLKRHLPFSGEEGLQELKKIAVRFEEKIYTAATSQSDYLRKISLKMLTMETKSQNPMV